MSANYPSDWDARRKEVYQRDNYTCQNCGITSEGSNGVELHAHHIVPKSHGGSHRKSNLVTLCRDCHSAIHNDVLAPTALSSSEQFSGVSELSEERWVDLVIDELRNDDEAHAIAESYGFNNCAVCNGSDSLVSLGHDDDQLTHLMCTECGTVLKLGMGKWKIIYSDYDIEDVTVVKEVWDEVANNRDSSPELLKQFEELSEERKGDSQIMMILAVGGGMIFVPITYFVFNILAAVVVLISFPVAGAIYDKRSERKIRKKLENKEI